MTQVDAKTLRKANSIHPISLFEWNILFSIVKWKKDILPVIRELEILVVALGALAHGLLGGVWSEERVKKSTGGFIPLFLREI